MVIEISPDGDPQWYLGSVQNSTGEWEPRYLDLPLRGRNRDRLRRDYGCVRARPQDLEALPIEAKEKIEGRWACGRQHTEDEPCAAGKDKMLFRVTISGKKLDLSIINSPLLHTDDGTETPYIIGKRSGGDGNVGGIDRTPLEPRNHHARRLDYGSARNASERVFGRHRESKGGYASTTWGAIAALYIDFQFVAMMIGTVARIKAGALRAKALLLQQIRKLAGLDAVRALVGGSFAAASVHGTGGVGASGLAPP
jgi:hypothetical protein